MVLTATQLTVDVIIPTYNTGAYIVEALQSVLAQTYPIQSIIIVDDGSTDTTTLTLKPLLARHPNIQYIKQENKGPNAARNTGLQHTQANLVAFLDADDIWFPEKIAEQITVYEKARYAHIGLVYCKYNTIDKNSKPLTTPIRNITPGIEGSCFETLLQGNEILSSSSGVLIKRTVFDTVGYFDETLRMAEDWDMWLRIAERYDIDYNPKILCSIRRHDSNSTKNTEAVLFGEIAFLNKWVPYINRRYAIPESWKNRIIGLVIKKRFSKTLIIEIKKRLSPEAHLAIFKKEGNSITLSCLLFLGKRIVTKQFWQKIYHNRLSLWNNN